MKIPQLAPGELPSCPVAPDSLPNLPRQQTHPTRWQGENWPDYVAALRDHGIEVREGRGSTGSYISDGGNIACGLPHGVVVARSAEQISTILKHAQQFRIPVTTRGGGLTTEGESVAYGGLLLDMTGMSQLLSVDTEAMTARVQCGIYWHLLAENLRRYGLDYLSAPLNMTSTVGGSLNVGGIDVNSCQFGCSADQAVSVQVVTPTGEIVECSDDENPELFQRVILGYGQFGVITEATLRVRPFTPIFLRYYYYRSLRSAIADLRQIDRRGAADYSGILTMMDRAITLLVAFDSESRLHDFERLWQPWMRGFDEKELSFLLGGYYALHPWKISEALFLRKRRNSLFPALQKAEYLRGEALEDRTVVFSRAVWQFWGGSKMVIPDIATTPEKFTEAVERGNAICKRYFPYYTLYCVGIKMRPEHKAHYEMSCMPPGGSDFAYGCEFEPIFEGKTYSRDTLQSFKNEIYDVGLDVGGSYYRFGGLMKGYIRRMFGNEVVDRHLALKRAADPEFILNRDVIF